MTTLVSIILYAGSVIFAAVIGVTAEQHKNGRADKASGRFGFGAMVLLFVLAACLQVSA